MTIDRIKYTTQIDNYGVPQWIGVEATIDSSIEDFEQCFLELKSKVDSLPLKFNEPRKVSVDEALGKKPDPKEVWVKSMIEEIEKCNSIDVKNQFNVQIGLLSYESAANSDARIKTALDLRMIQLKQKQ